MFKRNKSYFCVLLRICIFDGNSEVFSSKRRERGRALGSKTVGLMISIISWRESLQFVIQTRVCVSLVLHRFAFLIWESFLKVQKWSSYSIYLFLRCQRMSGGSYWVAYGPYRCWYGIGGWLDIKRQWMGKCDCYIALLKVQLRVN